ncbi:MAG TPA: hypothetical protein VGK74_02835 [Symbiobacteriaceae bacterium]
MIKTLLLVPIRDNDGRPFSPEDWKELEQKLLRNFGGFTDGGLVRGAWNGGDTVYRDTNRRFEVALDSWTKAPQFLDLAHWTRTHFRQAALYIEVAGIPEILGE